MAKAQNSPEITVSKIEPQLVTAPAISYSGAPSKLVPSKKWAEIETTFAWQPSNPAEKYTDDLTVNYYVLLNNKGSAVSARCPADGPDGACLGATRITGSRQCTAQGRDLHQPPFLGTPFRGQGSHRMRIPPSLTSG